MANAFTVHGGQVSPGIQVEADERLGMAIILGERGRGRELTKVKLDGRRPPPFHDAHLIYAAGLVAFSVGGVERHALIESRLDDPRVLLRVNTGAIYTRGTSGTVRAYWGGPTRVTEGYGAFGDAGRLGTWEDSLWLLSPGDALWVSPSGGYKREPYVICHPAATSAPRIWSPVDYLGEVIRQWIERASPEEIAVASELAVQRKHTQLAKLLASPEATEEKEI